MKEYNIIGTVADDDLQFVFVLMNNWFFKMYRIFEKYVTNRQTKWSLYVLMLQEQAT